jgi:hypothetical protein
VSEQVKPSIERCVCGHGRGSHARYKRVHDIGCRYCYCAAFQPVAPQGNERPESV